MVYLTVHPFIYRIVCKFKNSIQCIVRQKPLFDCWILKWFLAGERISNDSTVHTANLSKFQILKLLFHSLLTNGFIGFLDTCKNIVQYFSLQVRAFFWRFFDTSHCIPDIEIGNIIHTLEICGVCLKVLTERSVLFIFLRVDYHFPCTHNKCLLSPKNTLT